MHGQLLDLAHFVKKFNRVAPELDLDGDWRGMVTPHPGAAKGVFDIRIDFDKNVIHEKRDDRLPALVLLKGIWSPLAMEVEGIEDNEAHVRVGGLVCAISCLGMMACGAWGTYLSCIVEHVIAHSLRVELEELRVEEHLECMIYLEGTLQVLLWNEDDQWNVEWIDSRYTHHDRWRTGSESDSASSLTAPVSVRRALAASGRPRALPESQRLDVEVEGERTDLPRTVGLFQ